MKINKDSWHFKLLESNKSDYFYVLTHGGNVTLCKYFWVVVANVLAFCGKWVGITMGCIAALSLLAVMLSGVVTFFFANWIPFNEVNARASFVGLTLTTICFICATIEAAKNMLVDGRIVPNYLKFKKSEVTVEHKPNLLLDYLKAKKAKVCPLITLED